MATKEVPTASAATYASAHVQVSSDEPWIVGSDGQPCAILNADTIVRVAPMNRQFGGWNNAHFSSHLRLPLENSTNDGIVVTLEAMARECVAVALSPSDSFELGKTYVVHFGAAGNVSTVIRRRLPTGTEAVDVTLPCRVCSERSWVSYWLAFLPNGRLYVGTGKVVGEKCIGSLDDSLYHQLRPAQDAVKFVGLSNSALGRNARPLKIRHVCVTTVPPFLPPVLQNLSSTDLPLVTVEQEQDDEETKRLMEEYQKECKKNRARANKFGIPYKEPSPQAFLQWSQARRLRANPEKGFITGMDIMAPEELAKQEARKARFGITDDNKKRKGSAEDGEDDQQEEQEGDTMMEEDVEPLPIVQAWDNEELVRQHRVDPPTSLYVNPPPLEEKRQETEEFAMDESIKEAALAEEKIHLFGIDWAAFKQIRTDDIMDYFSSYGPSYVEWLGELSCNVLFEDKFSASRALQHMSQELPSPPPPEVSFLADPGQNPPAETDEAKTPPDFGNMGWRFCQQPIRKKHNDRFGRRGTTARMLMRVANSADVLVERPMGRPKPPRGFSTKRVLGPGSDFDTEPRQKKRRRVEREERMQEAAWDPSSGGEHPALSRGLMSGREGGFSVEELQRERAQKTETQSAGDDHPTEEDA